MANLRNIQFLRNSAVYGSLEAAKTALTTKASDCLDGSAILGRYTSGNETRTIMALVYNGTCSFLLNEKEIKNALDGLDFGPKGGSEASVINWIQQTDGVISATTENVGNLVLTDYVKGSDSGSVAATDSINDAIAKLENQIDAEADAREAAIDALDYNLAADANKVIVSLNQTDGAVSAESVNISGIKLAGYAEGNDADIAATDTLGQALGKLQAQINAMDLTVVSGEGEVITAVSEDDGKVSASKTAIKDVKLTGYVKDTTKTGAIAATDDVEDALSKLENQIGANTVTNADGSITVTTTGHTTDVAVNIKSGENVIKLDADGNGIYTDIKIASADTAGLGANVREAYQLLDSDGNKLGEYIKIYKDQTLKSASYANQILTLTYITSGGTEDVVNINLSELITENEFGNGIQVIDHVASVKIDGASEGFLTVSSDGIKLDGVADAITDAVEALDAVESGSTTHISVTVGEADGKLTAVTVTEDDIASAQGLADEITARTAADTELSNRLGTGVTTTDTATAQFAALSGNSNSVSGDTSVEGAKRYADAILANNVASLDANVSGNSTHVTVGVVEEDGVITAVTVAESDIANATDLAELSGKTVTAITSANGSITASIDDAVGNKTYNIETTARQISGLTTVADSDKGAAKISGVSETDSVQTAVDNLYKSIESEIDARKAAIAARTISGDNAISVTETANGDGFGTQLHLVLDDSTIGTGTEGTGDYNALSVTNDGLFLSTIWECGTF